MGAALLLAFFGALLVAVFRASRASSALGVAGIGAFAYWTIHGSADWFWEIAGLGGAAFALAGLAAATLPRHPAVHAERAAWGARVLGPLVGAALVAALVLPWLSEREVERAGQVFRNDPGTAIAHLRRASALDPLDPVPPSIEGAAWLRVGDTRRARTAFESARKRDGDAFAPALQLAAIASASGDPQAARVLIRRAQTLAPRDPTAVQVARVIRAGRRVDLDALQQALAGQARDFGAR